MINLSNKKVIVTGPKSMIGRSVIRCLKDRRAIIWPIFHEDVDLLNLQQTKELFEDIAADYCVHLAGFNGNIRFNSVYPSDIYFKTSMMGLNVLSACQQAGIMKVVSALSSCGYRASEEALKEKDFLNGEPDESTEAHAYGKRDLLVYSKLLHKQHDFNAVCGIFNTCFGPHDSFDLNKTKVVGSLIKKFVDAKQDDVEEVICWGTGKPMREIVFSNDVGELLVQTLEKYEDPTLPLNLGFNHDVSIRDLSKKIAELVGYTGDISWDHTRTDGQFRKLLDSSRMKDFGIELQETPLDKALLETIEWYKGNTK